MMMMMKTANLHSALNMDLCRVMALNIHVCEPVWPSGKAVGW